MASDRIGVVLVNTGTPSKPTPEAVQNYLRRFLSHPRIRPMNQLKWSIILNMFILPQRSAASALKYQSIWTFNGSPFTIELQQLEDALNAQYAEKQKDVVVRYTTSFDKPFLSDVMKDFYEMKCSRVLILPLFPQSAFSTTGVVQDDFNALGNVMKQDMNVTLVDHYYDNPLYIEAIAKSILNAGFDASANSNDHLMMSFHSIPLNDIDSGDTYDAQTAETCTQIAKALGISDDRWSVGYQCRFDKERNWLEPYTSNTLKDLAGNNDIGRLFFVCPNFSIDCLETLYDIDHEIKPLYLDLLMQNNRPQTEESFIYVPCLNSSEAQIRLITDIIKKQINV